MASLEGYELFQLEMLHFKGASSSKAQFTSRAAPRRTTAEILFYKSHRVDPVGRPLAYRST